MNEKKLPDGGILFDDNDDEREDDVLASEPSPIDTATPDIDWDSGWKNESGLKGMDLIAEFVKHLPNSPGVYRMFNEARDVMYVGKAKSLKKRVSNYAQGRFHTNRIGSMVRMTVHMEFVTTRTETEALLLEANLIKRFRPRFNVLLRDDKSFPYILITGGTRAPAIMKHRGSRARNGSYFGPFASAGAVGRTINSLQRSFLIRTCTDSVFESRTRPCLLHQIKRCAGPCTHEISDEAYDELVQEARDFLSGKSQKVKETIAQHMNEAAEDLDFERAAVLRDRLASLSHVTSHQGVNPMGIDEADVFAIYHEGGISCIQVFFFRTGQNWGNRAYFPKADPSLTGADVLNAFLAQFYDDKPIPRQILLSETVEEQDLLAAAFTEKVGYKVTLSVPQRGEKKDVVKQVHDNAREAHGRRLAETASQTRLLKGMAETFALSYVPRRIEVYDNSHIMGTNAVGGMVVAGPEGFVKNQYRKFNIKSTEITPGDDFGMMREVMTRRFSRLIKENGLPNRSNVSSLEERNELPFPAWPDVILIDGGQGQMSAVRKVLDELGIRDVVTAIGIAKGPDRDAGRERFFTDTRSDFSLPPRDPVLYFVQRIRDEVHRFAIGTHRAKRKKEMLKNPLDEISGIGPGRKRALLQHFGTAKAVSRAAFSDLKVVPGISEQVAKQIYNHFNENGVE
jgi:excinuclease ABC subunit C